MWNRINLIQDLVFNLKKKNPFAKRSFITEFGDQDEMSSRRRHSTDNDVDKILLINK